jgi:hypothetical protein
VGPVAEAVEDLKNMAVDPKGLSLQTLPSDSEDTKPLKIGIIGFGTFGQFLAGRLSKKHDVSCVDLVDKVRITYLMLIPVQHTRWQISPSPCSQQRLRG